MKSKRSGKEVAHQELESFDAVKFMRTRREELGKETEGMTPDEELKFFAEKFVEYKRKIKDTK
jgi:hypothetical protein